MKLTTLAAALAVTTALAGTAQAREYHGRYAVHVRHVAFHAAAYRSFARRHWAATPMQEASAWRGQDQSWSEPSSKSWSEPRSMRRSARRVQDGSWSESWSMTYGQTSYERRSYRRTAANAFAWSPRRARPAVRTTAGYAISAHAEMPADHGGFGPRPRAWCGWQMRHLVGGDPGSQYNLARNWAHWGHAGPAGVGAVVVWSHHVGKIVGQQNGQWVVESGNDGNRVRIRPLPIGRAIAIRWG